MERRQKRFLHWLVLFLLVPVVAAAQETQPKLQLSLVRNFGYGGGARIQGSFTLKIKDPPDQLESVAFYLDDQQLAEIHSIPFQVQFTTSDHPVGEHTFSALGTMVDKSKISSNKIKKIFLSSEQAWAETQRLIVPILLFTGVLALVGAAIPVLFSWKKDFVVGKYGPAGGAVCPRCQLPFSRPVLSPNLILGKLVRCPHCGKVNLLSRSTPRELEIAENRYTAKDTNQIKPTSEQDYYQQLEDSRFEN